ncbi:MAG: hypothetical protein AB7V06_16310 [Candidatus Obscuribacterales bacterium]
MIFRPNYIDGNELLAAFPEIVEGKFVIRTWQKGEFLVPQSCEPGVAWDLWFENGVLGQVSLEDVDMSFEDEIFVYNDSVSPESFYDLKATDTLDENLVRTILELGPETYINTGCPFRLATSDLNLHQRLYSCELIKEALDPMIEQDRWLKVWLDSQESVEEECRYEACQERRIKLSIFCGKHHLNMLRNSASEYD